MATTVSISNTKKPAPKWFLKLKKAISRLTNAAVIIMLAMGYADNSMAMLIAKVAISAVLDAVESILADDGDEQNPVV